MTKLGFTRFDEAPAPVKPTVQEMIASLSASNRTAILNGFVKEKPPGDLAHDIFVNKAVIVTLYRGMIQMRNFSRKRMRGEILITGPVYGDNGEITTPAVYNTPPATSVDLIAEIKADLNDEYNTAQVTAILTRMVKESKHDGSGTWIFYKAEIVK